MSYEWIVQEIKELNGSPYVQTGHQQTSTTIIHYIVPLVKMHKTDKTHLRDETSSFSFINRLERKTGIEPALTDWKSVVMPLDHIRMFVIQPPERF